MNRGISCATISFAPVFQPGLGHRSFEEILFQHPGLISACSIGPIDPLRAAILLNDLVWGPYVADVSGQSTPSRSIRLPSVQLTVSCFSLYCMDFPGKRTFNMLHGILRKAMLNLIRNAFFICQLSAG